MSSIILAFAEGQCPGSRASESASGEGGPAGFGIWPREVWWPAGRVRCCHQKPRASAHPTASKEEQITGTYNIHKMKLAFSHSTVNNLTSITKEYTHVKWTVDLGVWYFTALSMTVTRNKLNLNLFYQITDLMGFSPLSGFNLKNQRLCWSPWVCCLQTGWSPGPICGSWWPPAWHPC